MADNPRKLLMSLNQRTILAWLLLVTMIFSIAWLAMGGSLPPADFTFVNHTEVKSIDPAIANGQPEGNILHSIFEGLTHWHPKSLEPMPGVAESWEISEDGLTYTFQLRDTARWSDGTTVTADDFLYALRRLLGPRSAAEYAPLAWCIKNAKKYNVGSNDLDPGDSVEIELSLPPDAVNSLRGEILRGKLVEIQRGGNEDERVYVVDVDGSRLQFRPIDDTSAVEQSPPPGEQWCRQVLLDFREVGIELLDPLTLRYTLEHPTAYFLSLTGYYPFFPVNRQCIERHGNPQWTKPQRIVTNGPYHPLFRRIRDRIRLARSATYWNREKVALELVDVLATEANTTALNLYMTGKVEWINTVPSAALRILLEEDPPRKDLNPSPYLAIYYYLLNTTRKPLDDVRVRKALSLALVREEITTKLLAAGEMPALNLVPPGIKGYVGQKTDPESVAEAQRLLAEAGFSEGKGFPRLDILYNTDESHQAIAELIRKQWQTHLGISVKTRNEEWASYQASQRTMKYNISRRAWIGDYVDPSSFLDMFVTDGEQNMTGWGDPEYDRLLEQAREETDIEERLRVLEQAERILMEQLPILPVYHYVSKNMVKPYVRGFYNNLQDHHPVWAIWIDRESEEPNEFMRSVK